MSSSPTLPPPCLSSGTSGVRLEQAWLTAYSTAARRARCLLGPVRRKQVSKWGKAEAPSLLLVHGRHFTACAQSPSRRRFLCARCRSVVSNFATPWTVARQAPLSMGFPRQEYWSGLPFLLQGIFPTQGLNPCLLHCKQILYCWATAGGGGEAQSGPARCFCCFNYLCYLSSLITCLEVFCCNGNSPNNLPTPNNILKLSWCLWSSTEELFFLNLYVASSTYRAIFSYKKKFPILSCGIFLSWTWELFEPFLESIFYKQEALSLKRSCRINTDS